MKAPVFVIEPLFNQAAVTHHERELPHDDFRRAHYDCRRSYYDFRMSFVSRVPVPFAFRNNTSGSGDEGDNAG
jgi:hypothetical protein